MIGSSRVELEIPLEVEQLTGGALRLAGATAVSGQAAGVDWNMLGMIRGDAVLHAPAHAQARDLEWRQR